MVILKWVLNTQGVVMRTGVIWPRIQYSGQGNEPLGSINGREFLE